MNVLIACEFSNIVADAFRKRGNIVYSCDLIENSCNPMFHYVYDVFNVLNKHKFDLMIAHPPCTYLCKAQMYLYTKEAKRYCKAIEAMEFIKKLYNCYIPFVAIENPIGYIPTLWKKPNQIIYPYQFGDGYKKDVCLWLKNLPVLKPTKQVHGRKSMANHVNSRMSKEEKGRIKSIFFPGIAKAMAKQWTDYIDLYYNLSSGLTPGQAPALSLDLQPGLSGALSPEYSPGKSPVLSIKKDFIYN